MNESVIKELHTVALLKDIPSEKLFRGDVGTIVSVLSDSTVEVEFINDKGETTNLIPIKTSLLMRLRMDVAPSLG